MVKEYIPEFDATVKYSNGDKAIVNGVESIYLFNPRSGKKEWIGFEKFKLNFNNVTIIEKPSIINMLKEFFYTYDRNPNEMEERFLIEQFKAEFNHWSKNV